MAEQPMAPDQAPGEVVAVAPKAMQRPHWLTGLARSWIALAAVVVFFARELLDNGIEDLNNPKVLLTIGIMVGIVAVVSLISGFIDFYTVRFIADEDELRIERNFLWSSSKRISYAKIQSIDVSQPFMARILGLAGVKIDVGGSGGATLEYLPKQRAESLRRDLLRRARSLRGTTPQSTTDGEASAEGNLSDESLDHDEPLETVLAVRAWTLLKAAFLRAELWTMMFVFGFVALLGLLQGQLALAAPWAIAVVSYFYSNVVQHLNFRIEQGDSGLRVSSGMLSTTSKSLKPDRIQAIAVDQSGMQRIGGLYRVRCTVLREVGSEDEVASTLLPAGSWADVVTVLNKVWPGVSLNHSRYQSQPDSAGILTPFAYDLQGWHVSPTAVFMRTGYVDRELNIVPHERVQGFSLRQGPLQRRLGLATVSMNMISGPVTVDVEHMAVDDARRFFDWEVGYARHLRTSPGDPSYLSAPRKTSQRGSHGAQPPDFRGFGPLRSKF